MLYELAAVHAQALFLALYASLFIRRQPLGWARLCWSVPFVVLCIALPILMDLFVMPTGSFPPQTPFAGVFSMGAMKVLSYSCGRGPLMLPSIKNSAALFAAFAVLPVVPADAFYASGGAPLPRSSVRTPLQLFLDFFKDSASTLSVCALLILYQHVLFEPVRQWLLVLALFLYLQTLYDIIAGTISFLTGFPLCPAFNKPWMSESLQDFWARRWNLATTYMLRTLIYEPLMEGRLFKPVSESKEPAGQQVPQARDEMSRQTAKFWASQATFFYSGVWHILLFYLNTNRQLSLRWPLFFIVQGPMVLLERKITPQLQRLPRALRIVLTNSLLIAVGGPIFVQPTEASGFAGKHLVASQKPLRLLTSMLPGQLVPGILMRAINTDAESIMARSA